MSELNDLLTTRELQRWRLILGEAAETTLCGLDDNARQIDHALEWLYGRDPERLQRGERSGGLGGSNLTTPEWINSIHTLFPQQVIERLESGEESLDASLKLFEEGTALAAYCYQKLNAAEQKIKELTLEEDSGEEAED